MTDVITIRPLAVADAAQLTACFQRCYGDSYVAAFFYDPAAIQARARDGRLQSVVAVTNAGEIVGHMALMRRHPEALTVEAGNTVVDPRFRGHGLAGRLGAALFGACRDGGAIGFPHYPTTAHPIMQKLAVQGGGVETGLMLAYIPADTDYRDLGGTSASGRLAVVVVYQPLAAAPAREVFLPPRFASLLGTLYARAGLARTARTPGATFVASATRLRSTFDPARGLLHVDVERGGADAGERIREATAGAAAVITHVDLPLSDPATPAVVEALRADGFFFCALLPEFAASDVLRLQRLTDPAEPRVLPELVHAEARAILDAALADRAAARAERGSSRT
jgi:predicted GNAT family acetyltransferase